MRTLPFFFVTNLSIQIFTNRIGVLGNGSSWYSDMVKVTVLECISPPPHCQVSATQSIFSLKTLFQVHVLVCHTYTKEN